MKTRKIYIIIEKKTNRILHTTTDRWDSMEMFTKLNINNNVIAQCIYQ